MSDFDSVSTFEDEYIGEISAENEQTRHGFALVHHKLFPKYGFLIPEVPLYPGETIFFGLTAHENASHKFIADLRDELHTGQKVEFMAVATEREGIVRWKAIIVTPLEDDTNNNELKTEGGVVNQVWLDCTVHVNLCPTHGFATPINGNPYYDNVYFTLREASAGLEKAVTDLTDEFTPGDSIRALVVPADSKFRAKYQAIMICKANKAVPMKLTNNGTNSTSSAPNKNAFNVESSDIPVLLAICETLSTKEEDDGVKLTSLAGDIGSNSDARAVVMPQKKALKRFLAKYPQYFVVKEDTVHTGPNVSINELKLKLETKKNEITLKKEMPVPTDISKENNIGHVTNNVQAENNKEIISNNKEKSASDVFAVFQSDQGVKLLADILIRHGKSMKIGDLLKSCQQQGWAGMKTTAMLTQLMQKKKNIFGFDDTGHVFITDEGKRNITFGIKKKDESVNKPKPPIGPDKQINMNEFPTPYESMLLRLSQPNSSFPQAEISQTGILGGLGSSSFSSNTSLDNRTRTAFATATAANLVAGGAGAASRKSYPLMLPGGDFFNSKTPIDTSLNFPKSTTADFVADLSLGQGIFPNGDLIPSKVSPFGVIGDTYLNNIYDSDNETTTSSQYGANPPMSKFSSCLPDEQIYLQTVSRAIFCQQNDFTQKLISENDNVGDLLQLLKVELENLGVIHAGIDDHSLKGILSKHLICIHLDEGLQPRAKFQYFTPSGLIQQSTVKLNADVLTWVALNSMIHNEHADIVPVMFESFYGIKDSLHWIRFLPSVDKQLVGCTVKFNASSTTDTRTTDQIRIGEGNKLKVIFSDKGTTSNGATNTLRKYVQDKNDSISVYVVDMEAQILGFKKFDVKARRSICVDLASQQGFLQNSVHFCPDYVVVNAVDSKSTLKIIKRLIDNNIRVFAEVYRPLEKTLYGIFGRPS